MDKKRKLIFCGGDRRLIYCASFFAADGFDCRVWRGETAEADGVTRIRELRQNCDGAEALILPIPAFTSSGKLICAGEERGCVDCEYIFKAVQPDTKIFGGKFADIVKRVAAEYNHGVCDYSLREEFSLMNAVPTAEAAISIAMNRLNKTLWHSKIAVMGYGRIGRALSLRLHALGARVTVAARSASARAAAESDGMISVELSGWLDSPEECSICFNTVPCQIVHDECAAAAGNTVFVDLASAPGGFTDEARSMLGDRLITALSLPGKYFPETAGRIIYRTVRGMLAENGERGDTK
ncbi:MAG: dipicolinate synthase subunit DpsA [Candidatus Avispirillum sp.]